MPYLTIFYDDFFLRCAVTLYEFKMGQEIYNFYDENRQALEGHLKNNTCWNKPLFLEARNIVNYIEHIISFFKIPVYHLEFPYNSIPKDSIPLERFIEEHYSFCGNGGKKTIGGKRIRLHFCIKVLDILLIHSKEKSIYLNSEPLTEGIRIKEEIKEILENNKHEILKEYGNIPPQLSRDKLRDCIWVFLGRKDIGQQHIDNLWNDIKTKKLIAKKDNG